MHPVHMIGTIESQVINVVVLVYHVMDLYCVNDRQMAPVVTLLTIVIFGSRLRCYHADSTFLSLTTCPALGAVMIRRNRL